VNSVIGFVGLIGSGKDEAANYFHDRHGYHVIATGDLVRNIADLEGLEPSRDNLHDISQRYAEAAGRDFLAKKIIQEIEAGNADKVVINSVHTLADVDALRQHYDDKFTLLHIDTSDPRKRFERVHTRTADHDPNSWDEFRELEKDEDKLFDLWEVISQADVTIPNDGSVEQLRNRLEKLMLERQIAHEPEKDQSDDRSLKTQLLKKLGLKD
jgi:dephospho-CoA kinase